MSPNGRAYTLLVARFLIAVLFLGSGYDKLTGFSGTVGYIASQGLPLAALGAVLAIVVELGGGLSVLTGWKTRYGAVVLALFLVPTTLIFHNVWAAPDQLVPFMKNLAIMGGLLVLAIQGPGNLALERWEAPSEGV